MLRNELLVELNNLKKEEELFCNYVEIIFNSFHVYLHNGTMMNVELVDGGGYISHLERNFYPSATLIDNLIRIIKRHEEGGGVEEEEELEDEFEFEYEYEEEEEEEKEAFEEECDWYDAYELEQKTKEKEEEEEHECLY